MTHVFHRFPQDPVQVGKKFQVHPIRGYLAKGLTSEFGGVGFQVFLNFCLFPETVGELRWR